MMMMMMMMMMMICVYIMCYKNVLIIVGKVCNRWDVTVYSWEPLHLLYSWFGYGPQKNRYQFHFVNHKSHMDWGGIEPGPPR
jgi:hypothetical protein